MWCLASNLSHVRYRACQIAEFTRLVHTDAASSKRATKSHLHHLQSLRQDPQARWTSKELVLFGPTMVREHMARRGVVKQLYVTRETDLRGIDTNQMLPIHTLTQTELQRVSGIECSPSDSCAAVVPLPPLDEPSTFSPSTLILDGVSDPGNVGSLLRSATAFNFHTVIMLGGCDPFNEKVIRASMGAVMQVRIWKTGESEFWRSWKERATSSSSHLVVCDSGSNRAIPLHDWRPAESSPLFLVIGHEARGVRSSIKSASSRVHIPMNPTVESLNAAIAGSILMQHTFAQHKTKSCA